MNKFFPITFILLFFSCNEDNTIVTPSSNDVFTANITLTNNSEPIIGADVFIRYRYDYNIPLSRPSQTISFLIPVEGYVQLKNYDLEDNLIEVLMDENVSGREYEITNDPSNPQQIAPTGIAITKIVLEFEGETQMVYSVLFTAPDFNQIANLGQTDELGEFTLTPEQRIYFPNLYVLPDIQGTDEVGNSTGYFDIDDYDDKLEIIFLYQGTYKIFDISLEDGSYNYDFQWNEGEDFTPNSFMDDSEHDVNRVNESLSDELGPPELQLRNPYPNPYN